MKTLLVSCLLFLVLFLSLVLSLPALAAATPAQQVAAAYTAEAKGGGSLLYARRVEIWRAIRERPEFATNAAARIAIGTEIVKLCSVPGMHEIRRWDKDLLDEIPRETQLVLDDPRYAFREKFPFAQRLAVWQASERKDFDGALKTVENLARAYPDLGKDDLAKVEAFRADWFRWQDRFDEAWTALARMAELNPRGAAKKAVAFAEGLGDYSRVHAFFERLGDPSAELFDGRTRWSPPSRTQELVPLAKAYVQDAKNPLEKRARVVAEYFCTDRSPEQCAFRASVKEADFSKIVCSVQETVAHAYRYADWELTLELLDLFETSRYLGKFQSAVVRNRLRLMCLGALGRREAAVALAGRAAEEKGVKPVDRAKFRMGAAILRKGDLAKVIADEKLTASEASEVWCTGSRQALLWGDSDASEFCVAEYEKLHKPLPKRSMTVAWFDKPIDGVDDWRRANLDCQTCDIKFGFSMDELVTDVATGRSPVKPSAFDSDDTRMEVSAACDPKGFHLFLRVKDPNARAVEGRFASGMTAEMYFAPGVDTPYVCLGTTPAHGVEFLFQPMYESRDYRHVDIERRGRDGSFGMEWSYSDTDYVQHLFFSWENYYQRLPKDGTVWKFDCISWTPKGGYTWAGSQGVHSCLSWGDLVFSLTPAQETAIRRGLLYQTRAKWRRIGSLDTAEWRTAGVLDVFEKWADLEIGDRAFSDEVLKPLEKELAGAMAEVKPEMSDADVNRVFDQVHRRCCGLKHEIDRLRRKWLLKELTK